MIFVHLSDEQRRELEQVSRQAVGRVALRAQMVLLSDRGYPVPFIAEIHACGMDVVRHWLHRYEEAGVKGLEDDPRSGRPRKDFLGPEIVDAQAQNSPRCSGLVQSCWTVGLLSVFLAVRFGLALSFSTVRRYLKLKDWRWDDRDWHLLVCSEGSEILRPRRNWPPSRPPWHWSLRALATCSTSMSAISTSCQSSEQCG